jgi:hypothetical protein
MGILSEMCYKVARLTRHFYDEKVQKISTRFARISSFIGDQLGCTVSLELQNIFHALGLSKQNLSRILAYLNCADVAELDHALAQATLQRQSQASKLYLLQQSQQTPSISYAIAPLLSSVLDYSTHYLAQAESWLVDFYENYFRMDALASAKTQSLSNMQLCLDLVKSELTALEFYIASLLQALLDPNTRTIVTLGSTQLILELKQQIQAYYGVQILEIHQPFTHFELNELEVKKLFWKRKDAQLAEASQKIAQDNSRLVAKLCHLSRTDAERFIEDLMYGEHVFEKVSVLGEFSDTIYKHQLENQHKLIA